eukprot:364027-Chlamydomonas_euryale.AAC.8
MCEAFVRNAASPDPRTSRQIARAYIFKVTGCAEACGNNPTCDEQHRFCSYHCSTSAPTAVPTAVPITVAVAVTFHSAGAAAPACAYAMLLMLSSRHA